MRTNTNIDDERLQELQDMVDNGMGDEIVTIDDQVMTAKQALTLYKSNDLTSVAFRTRQTGIK